MYYEAFHQFAITLFEYVQLVCNICELFVVYIVNSEYTHGDKLKNSRM